MLAKSDPAEFLAVVAAARGNFLVVEERRGALRDYVAIYEFKPTAAAALVDCHRKQGGR